MKKITLVVWTIIIVTLTACSSATNGTGTASPQNGDPSGELPVTTQLILGTLKLAETDRAVTAKQASELLPLWQTLQDLSESDTAAAQETEALITQIQETMTAEQMQAIADMNLSRQDMMTVMQEQGMALGAGPASSSNSNTQNGISSTNSGGNFAPGGGMPPPDERGLPGGGPGFGGQGQNMTDDQIATAQAARQAGGGTLVPTSLINAMIEYLQKKAGS